MPEGIDVNGGGIDMYPDETKAQINGLKAAIQTADNNFQANLGTIAGLDSQLGNGTLGAAAYMKYQPAVDDIVPKVRQLFTQSSTYGDDGLRCVGKYVEQDQKNKGIYQGVQPPSTPSS